MHTQTTELKAGIELETGIDETGIVVVGAGRWGNHLVRNFLAHPHTTLRAVVDSQGDCLQKLGQRYELSPRQLVTADQWDSLLHRDDVDAVAIATPASTHYPLITAALRHGKHVFVEKPITVDTKEALELCDLASSLGLQLMVDHTYLFNSAVDAGQQVLRQRMLGPLRYGYATRTHLGPIRQDVDALWDLAIHDISIFSHWLNEFPCQVQAQGQVWLQSPSLHPEEETQADFLLFPRGLSDRVWITLRYPSGIEVSIHLCWANPDKQRRLCLVGDQGTLIFDELHDPVLQFNPGHLVERHNGFSPEIEDPVTIDLEPTEPLYQACDHFLQCIQTNTPSTISSGRLGAKFVEILQALTTSLNRGGIPIILNGKGNG